MDNSTKEVLNEYEKATETHAAGQRVVGDYSRFDPRSRGQETEDIDRREHVRRNAPLPRARVSFTAIFLYLVIAGFAMLLLNSYVNVTVLTNKLTDKTAEYEKLQTEYIKLQADSDQQYNLKEIEEYAVNELGMTKVEAGQIEAVALATEESITVIDGDSEEMLSGTFDELAKKFRSFLEFLA